jgi:hypothetical protein
MRRAVLLVLTGCALNAELGAVQHAPLDHAGGSLAGHLGIGGAGDRLFAVQLDARVDVAEHASRFIGGGSVAGGVSLGPAILYGRAGIWHAVVSSAPEDSAVPSFELAGYVPLETHRDDNPQHGSFAQGVTFGVRDDLDTLNAVTVFVGVALFMMPGY